MIECEVMQDRMPDVARGLGAWTDAEANHLADCEACAQEWRLVQTGVSLGGGVTVDADRIAERVTMRLRTEPKERPAVRRLPWRGGVVGLLAAAASVLIVVHAPRPGSSRAEDPSDTTVAALAPELQGMDDRQLNVVLQSLQPAAADNLPSMTAHLDDLTDAQLERLLHAMGGE